MGGRRKSQTIGYRYYMGMHLAVCHGPVDAVTEIQVGERTAWTGNVTSNGQININAEGLFGGDRAEGGVSGAVDVAFGGATQTPNDYLLSRIGAPQPAYRGILGLILRQVYISANNPYVKPWAVRVKRCWAGWYSSKSNIGGAANPAHIIYECLTNADWGMGYPSGSIDDASFRAAADTLYAEGFGISMLWSRQSKIEQFIQDVLDHIAGILTTSPSTGRFVLRLVRGGYDVNTLPILNTSNAVLESYQRAAWGETTNEIVVVYTNPATAKETSIAVQDLANIQTQGAVVSQTRRYPGITSDSLASRVAMRDLAAVSTPMARVRLRANRSAWRLYPGDVFRFMWPTLGIESMAMRVISVDGGELKSGTISIDAVEDVFGLPSVSYTTSQPIGWTDPLPPPSQMPYQRLLEAPYWDIARSLSAADMAYLDPTDCYLQSIGARPSPGARNYEMHIKKPPAMTYEYKGRGDFCPTAVLTAALAQEVSSFVMYNNDIDVDLVNPGTYAYVDDEVVHVAAINHAAKSLTLTRGVLDTVPVAHASGARIWFADGNQYTDSTEYAVGETVEARLLTATGLGVLQLSMATANSITMTRRQNRPYPPGNVKINNVAYPVVLADNIHITWSHRDRTTQTAGFVSQNTSSIGPEPGVTYNVRIYGEGGALQRTYSGLTSTYMSYSLTDDKSDSGLDRPNARLRIEIESARAGVTSWQAQSIAFDRAGYGLNYGKYYGGV